MLVSTLIKNAAVKAGLRRGERMRETRLWVTTAPPREGPWTVFDFTVSRAADGPKNFLKGFHGWLACDAYGGYPTPALREYFGRRPSLALRILMSPFYASLAS